MSIDNFNLADKISIFPNPPSDFRIISNLKTTDKNKNLTSKLGTLKTFILGKED
jgi:hypothetical protein